jgi:predicted O-methyltransferase YrrM
MAARVDTMTGQLEADADARTPRSDASSTIVNEDVTRYADVIRALPDALLLATQNLTVDQQLPLIDPDTAQLIATMLRLRHVQHVLEVGAGAGYLTVQLARALDADSTLTSIEEHPIRHGQVHAFLGHAQPACNVELRLGDPERVIRSLDQTHLVDVLVLADPAMDRIALLDAALPLLATDALVFAPFALRGGRVADQLNSWGSDVEHQRSFNRAIANDVRFTDTQLLPVGDGLLLARRT